MLAWVANQFARNGHEVHFVAVYSDEIGQPLDESIEFTSLNCNQSKHRIVRNTVENLKVQIRLKKEVERIKPDVVIGFLYPVDLYFTLFNSFHNKYKVLLSQRLDPYIEKGWTAKIKKYIIGKADGVVFQTKGAYKYYSDLRLHHWKVISNPVTSRTLSYASKVFPFTQRDDCIVLPARLDISQKRQDIMIDAFYEVHKRHPEMRLMLLGDGPDKVKIQRLIESKDLGSTAFIHNAVNTAEDITVNCKIVCLTSDYEGMPNSLIEAMGMGINVVATDCRPGGARELIKDGVNGFLVNQGDYRELANKIIFLLDNPDYADKLANEAKKLTLCISENAIGNQWIQFAKEVVNK